MGKSDLFAPFFKAIFLFERNENTFPLNSCYIYHCSCFHVIVNEISRNKAINYLKRLTAVDTAAEHKY